MDYERAAAARKRRSRICVIGGVVALVVIIAIGVTVGVVVSKNNNNDGDKKSSSSSSTNGTTQTNPNDPSSFTLDARLHKSFYGMAYTPEGSLMPDCGNKLEDVIKDMQILSQLTSRVRLYGSDCNQGRLVLEAIKQTKVDMEVFLGNYVLPDQDDVYERQRDEIKSLIEEYGTDHIAGVTVGNEYMLNYVGVNGEGTEAEVTGAIGNAGAVSLIKYIRDTRTMLEGLNLAKAIPIGNSDAGSFFHPQVLAEVDYGLSNVHAWFANVTSSEATSWTTEFFNRVNVDAAAALPNKPTMYIAETGWPSGAKDVVNSRNGPGLASDADLQIFLDDFVCQSNAAGVPYFYFEFFDEEWKDLKYGGVEGYWGLFTKDRQLKDIKIPVC